VPKTTTTTTTTTSSSVGHSVTLGVKPKKLIKDSVKIVPKEDAEKLAEEFFQWASSVSIHEKGNSPYETNENPSGAIELVLLPEEYMKLKINQLIFWCCSKLNIPVSYVKYEGDMAESAAQVELIKGIMTGLSTPLPVNWKEPVSNKDFGYFGVQFLKFERALKSIDKGLPINFVHPAIRGEGQNRCLTLALISYTKSLGGVGPAAVKLVKKLLSQIVNSIEISDIQPIYEKHKISFSNIAHNCKQKGEATRDKVTKKLVRKTKDLWDCRGHPLLSEIDIPYIETRYRTVMKQIRQLNEAWDASSITTQLTSFSATFLKCKELYKQAYEESSKASAKIGHRTSSFKTYCKKYGLRKGKEIVLDQSLAALYKAQMLKPVEGGEKAFRFLSSVYCIMTDIDKQSVKSDEKSEDKIIEDAKTQLRSFEIYEEIKGIPISATLETFNFFQPLSDE